MLLSTSGLFQKSNEKNNQRGNIQINGDLTRRNSELLAALRIEAKKKDKVQSLDNSKRKGYVH